jgi:RND superfamily putative drug exporter
MLNTLRARLRGRTSDLSLPPPRTPWGRAARLAVRFRWAVIAFWIAAALLVTLTLPTLEQAQVGALGDLVPTNSAALDAELRSSQLFSFPLLSRTLVVQRDARGLSTFQEAAAVNRAVALNQHQYPGLARISGALVITNLLGKPPFSRESSTTAITYLFFKSDVSPGLTFPRFGGHLTAGVERPRQGGSSAEN